MPIYEYQCSECYKPFEKLVLSSKAANAITCPDCGSSQVQKQISTFASKSAGGSLAFNGGSAASCAPSGA